MDGSSRRKMARVSDQVSWIHGGALTWSCWAALEISGRLVRNETLTNSEMSELRMPEIRE
jgi:hypothetical protein